MSGPDPRQVVAEVLGRERDALVALSRAIHADPELGLAEHRASARVADFLAARGFAVERGVAGMPTAVSATAGSGPFHVAVLAEYDALPEVGHACGHNVICAAGVGAAVALAAVADAVGLRVTLMGTPAEETAGGKIGFIRDGRFADVHAAMMVHPWPRDEADPAIIAIRQLHVRYMGKEAHAAGFPHLGINAADAMVVAQTAIALLRQHLEARDRVHGIVTTGGAAPNIVPAFTEGHWMVRARDLDRLDEVTRRVRDCFHAGALATGCTVAIREHALFADVAHDPDLARIYAGHATALGRTVHPAGAPVSTDMGNVSYVVPTIHPMLGIETHGAVNHQPEFAAACATPDADRAVADGALALARTAIDAALDPALRARLMAHRPDPAVVARVTDGWSLDGGADAAAADAPDA